MNSVKLSFGEQGGDSVLRVQAPGSARALQLKPGESVELMLRAGEGASIRCLDVSPRVAPVVTDASGAPVTADGKPASAATKAAPTETADDNGSKALDFEEVFAPDPPIE